MSQKKQPTAADADWRTGMRTASERYAHLLETGEGADVFFMVGKPGDVQELIAAHKFILSTGSSVFERQFSFGSAIHSQEGNAEKPIEVPDISPDGFRAMLAVLYSDDFSGVTKQNIMGVLYAAKKYLLDSLVGQCHQFIMQNLNASNVLSVLKHSKQYGDPDMIHYFWSLADRNATRVLKSEEFLALNQQDLCELLSRDSLQVYDELFVFNSLHRWAIVKCIRSEKVEPAPENLRNVIGEAIYQIRFPLMSQEDFTNKIVPTNLLSNEDVIALYVHFTFSNGSNEAKRKFPNRFNGRSRQHPDW